MWFSPMAFRARGVFRRARGAKTDLIPDERGGITIFVLILFILLLVAGGMAVDYQRYELARADLQDALDRGVLAATNGDQTYDMSGAVSLDDQAKLLIGDYMSSRNYKPNGMNLAASVTQTTGGRAISASAREPVETIFLRLLGITRMDVVVNSGAIQAAPKLEITLVLDVSGSMGWNSTSSPGTKLAQLKVAAKEFLKTVLTADSAPNTLITVVPFSQQVNLPKAMADQYNLKRLHTYSSCFDYRDLNFGSTAMPTKPATAYRQGQHFIETGAGGSTKLYGCPLLKNAITPYSNSLTQLSAAIDALAPESFTATYMGVKWGAALLDPTSRPVVDAMIAAGTLPKSFAGWPHSWTDGSVRKITVVMSDGQNTQLNAIYDSVYAKQTVTYWNSNAPRSGEKYSIIDNDKTGQGDVVMKKICDQAKVGTNSTVYTIGFELAGQPKAEAALKDCASAPSTFYLVNGVEISTAFKNIADEIVNLKLTN